MKIDANAKKVELVLPHRFQAAIFVEKYNPTLIEYEVSTGTPQKTIIVVYITTIVFICQLLLQLFYEIRPF